MSLFVEYHLIQNFAPSNLNRDDTGAPKDAIFGGYRRARVSSQCFKRAARLLAGQQGLLPPEAIGVRTKKLVSLLEQALAARGRHDAQTRITGALAGAGLAVDSDGKTEYLLFLGQREIDAFAAAVEGERTPLATGEDGVRIGTLDPVELGRIGNPFEGAATATGAAGFSVPPRLRWRRAPVPLPCC